MTATALDTYISYIQMTQSRRRCEVSVPALGTRFLKFILTETLFVIESPLSQPVLPMSEGLFPKTLMYHEK